VSKRQREEQLEPVVPPTSEARLPGSDSFESPASPPHPYSTYHPSSHESPHSLIPLSEEAASSDVTTSPCLSLSFIPDSLCHTPHTLEFLEAYDEICRCEFLLNTCSTPSECADILADCYMACHRVHDQVHHQSYLLDRLLDLECNIKLKQLRLCHQLVRVAAQLADDIITLRYSTALLPSQETIAVSLRTVDDILFYLHPALENVYISNIRPILVRYWEQETSSSECGLDGSSHTSLPPSPSSALSESPERELFPF
jgi:hypothetical protein